MGTFDVENSPVKEDVVLWAHSKGLANEVHVTTNTVAVDQRGARSWLKETSEN